MKNNAAIIIIVVAITAAASLFAGMKYQENVGNTQAQNFRTRLQGAGNRMGFRPVAGEIISADEKSITVRSQDDSSKIVLITNKTDINKAEKATINDLKNGQKVAVFGTENSDGSVTAQTIQLNPQFTGIRNRQP